MMGQDIQVLFDTYTSPQSYKAEYGTAGFRSHADNLDAVAFRCGVLMALRAKTLNKTCGVMITASHNPECDNGVKLVDFNGEMIDEEWEHYATKLAQATNFTEFYDVVFKLSNNVKKINTSSAYVLIGIDTRKSGKKLAQLCEKGVSSIMGVKFIHLGCVTTPELHFYTHQSNQTSMFITYNQYLLENFKQFHKTNAQCLLEHFHYLNKSTITTRVSKLHIDCANGVGALRLEEMIDSLYNMGLDVILYNTGNGKLNDKCGADYVEKELKFPANMENIEDYDRCCSIDGDADRIVYFTKVEGKLELLNGDKIACLLAHYINKIYTSQNNEKPTIGLIQTAYSNGASTLFIKNTMPNIKVQCTHTGVHHLHKEAKHYDIGIYFEANGHGTVLFNNAQKISPQLRSISCLLSQFVGDAIGNMLAIECVLSTISFKKWIALYKDMATKQEKIYTNKDAFETTDFGRVCVKPDGLQTIIDTVINEYIHSNARAFVRPSGTEDLVRLYVESTQDECLEDIATKIKDAIKTLTH